jgi:LacI family transcriptional regulator, galactose operon repressor
MSTMRDVAALAGVSAKTVSRVMHNDRYVSDEVRTRVEAAIRELKYVPNTVARTFRSGRDAAIGIAVPDISDPFFATLTHSVEQIARANGVAVFVTSLGGREDDERAGVEALLGRQIAGLISTPISADQSYLKHWQPRTAIVFIDRMPSRITADSVVEDNYGGAYDATAHLLGHGHRRIAFIGDTLSIATTAGRLAGYHAALADAGVESSPEMVALGATSTEEAGAVTVALMGLAEPPTALLSSNARSSIGVVPALQSVGRPDLPVISFGDFPLARALRPALTVVDQDPVSVGRIAATRLFERLENPGRRLKRKIVLPVSLVVRESCGPPGTHQEPRRPERPTWTTEPAV